jgi:hypothetical protein
LSILGWVGLDWIGLLVFEKLIWVARGSSVRETAVSRASGARKFNIGREFFGFFGRREKEGEDYSSAFEIKERIGYRSPVYSKWHRF